MGGPYTVFGRLLQPRKLTSVFKAWLYPLCIVIGVTWLREETTFRAIHTARVQAPCICTSMETKNNHVQRTCAIRY